MPKTSRRPVRKPASREVLDRPLLLTLAAGLAVFVALQVSFDLAAITAVAVGLAGWLGLRRLARPSRHSRVRRSRPGRHRT